MPLSSRGCNLRYRFHNFLEEHHVRWAQPTASPPTWNDLRAYIASRHRIRMLDYGPSGRIELVARLRDWGDKYRDTYRVGDEEELDAPLDADAVLQPDSLLVIACRRVTELHIDHPYLAAHELADWRLFFQVVYRPMREIADRMPWPLFLLNLRTQHFNPFAMKRLANAPMPSYSREGEEEYWATCRGWFTEVKQKQKTKKTRTSRRRA